MNVISIFDTLNTALKLIYIFNIAETMTSNTTIELSTLN